MDSRMKKGRIYALLERYDKKLVIKYLEYGPTELRNKLSIESDRLWKIIFDYLVFEKEVVKKCIRQSPEYIHEIFAEKGPEAIKSAFQLEGKEYDDVLEYVIDYIGISRGAIFEYVTNQASEFRHLIYSGKASRIRKSLCIDKEKYERVWGDILDILLECVSTHAFSHSMFEQGLQMFCRMYNSGRQHRSIKNKLAIDVPVKEEE